MNRVVGEVGGRGFVVRIWGVVISILVWIFRYGWDERFWGKRERELREFVYLGGSKKVNLNGFVVGEKLERNKFLVLCCRFEGFFRWIW